MIISFGATYVFSGETQWMLWKIFRSWHLHVVTGGSASTYLNYIFGKLRVPNLLNITLLKGSLPLS
jgi:hypothetical protein